MQNFLETLPFNPDWLITLAIISLILFLLSLIFIPWLVTRLPVDYFVDEKKHRSQMHDSHPIIYYIIKIVKNVIGGFLIITGIFMLILPGQGLLTILVGVGIADFPGKFKLLRRIAKQPLVLKSMNWIREKTNKTPLQEPL